jgi:diketogulonate reductase-like aldo/keto reductase
VVLNWHVKFMGHNVFPRMTREEHLAENMQIFEFDLDQEDYKKISRLNKDVRFYDRVPVEKYNWIPLAV